MFVWSWLVLVYDIAGHLFRKALIRRSSFFIYGERVCCFDYFSYCIADSGDWRFLGLSFLAYTKSSFHKYRAGDWL
jgi:hypothetical protein